MENTSMTKPEIDMQVRNIWHDLHAAILRYKPALLTLLTEYADGAPDSLKQSVYRNPGIYAGNADDILHWIGMERFLVEYGPELQAPLQNGYKTSRICEALLNLPHNSIPPSSAKNFIADIVYAISMHPTAIACKASSSPSSPKPYTGHYICHGLRIRSSVYDVLKSFSSPKTQKKLSKQLTKLQDRPCIRIVRQILEAPAAGVTWNQFKQDNASHLPVILTVAQCAFRASETDLEYFFNAITDNPSEFKELQLGKT